MTNDLISRQAVIDLHERLQNCEKGNSYIAFDGEFYTTDTAYAFDGVEIFFNAIMKLPPAITAEVIANYHKEHGEWIQEKYWSEGCGMGESYGHWFRCSKCGNRVKDGYKKCGLNFCSKCGADMRGEK